MGIATCAGLLVLMMAAEGAGGGGAAGGGPTRQRAEAGAGSIHAAVPKKPDKSGYWVIYLHGAIIEDEGRRPTHPTFGTYEYDAILTALAAEGLHVISAQRPPRTDPRAYARTVAAQVDSLRAAGVPAERITVMGFSKGGAIAILASAELADPQVGFVFMACCADWITRPGLPVVAGRILSIHEASDDFGHSCGPLLERAADGSVVREIEISTGKLHGAFYDVRPEWFGPAVGWCFGEAH